MSVTTSRIPRRLAILGIVIGFGLMSAWWYVDTYDPFHLPTWQQAQAMGSFSAPPLLKFLTDITFVLCPGALLHIYTMDTGSLMTYITWTAAAMLNGPLYYAVGLAGSALMRKSTRR
jgi:hypothetical protein